MRSFEELSILFKEKFDQKHFPPDPGTLYEPADYFLTLGGKRIRPVICLMSNELFDDVGPDAFNVAIAIELFHNFTLIHDDIMDKAPLRRGMQTVHARYSEPSAILAGDVMLIVAYDYLNRIKGGYIHKIIQLFNRTAREVCEGQQLDMDFETLSHVQMESYIRMIELKTSVLLAASLQLGAILGGAGMGNQLHLYEFGRNLGISFQVQDDYLDAFGDPVKFGKQVGGDILSNKKTFLMIKALEVATPAQLEELKRLSLSSEPGKVETTLNIFQECGVDKWAMDLKEAYVNTALQHLEETAVVSYRKEPMKKLVAFLIEREY
jgi:geranylgeranyl diphosphate synthase type II